MESATDAPSRVPPSTYKTKACENCAYSKIKCTWLDDQICKRCSKNNVICVVPVPRVRAKRAKSRRVATLEQRIDGIMSLLTENKVLETHGSLPRNLELYRSQVSPDRPLGSLTPSQKSPNDIRTAHDEVLIPPDSLNLRNDNRELCIEITCGLQVPVEEADQALKEYINDFCPQFPFVPVPYRDAWAMHMEQPLLLKTILLTCRLQSHRLMSAGVKWFREHISQHVVVLNEKRLEILQAILVFLSWRGFYFFVEGEETYLLQLAGGLLGALGLHRSPPNANGVPKTIFDAAAALPGRDEINAQPPQTNAGRRAALGFFYVTSIVSNFFGRITAPIYTTHLDQCCKDLSNSREYQTDYLLVQVIQLQKLSTVARRPLLDADQHQLSPRLHAMAISSIQRELDGLMGRLPEDMNSNHLLSSHYYNVLIQLYELAIYEPSTQHFDETFSRPRRLWKCLDHARSSYSAFLLAPPEFLSVMPFVIMAHLSFTNAVTARLLMLDHPGWDASTARQAVDFPAIAQRMITFFQAGDYASGLRRRTLENGQGVLAMYAEKWNWARDWYCLKVSTIPAVSDNITSMPLVSQGTAIIDDAQWWQILLDPSYEGFASIP